MRDILLVLAILALLIIGGFVWAGNNRIGNDTTDDETEDVVSDDETTDDDAAEVDDTLDDGASDDEGVVSDSGNIRVTFPLPDAQISASSVTIIGEARVFENAFNWRVKAEDGTVLAEGFGTANAPDVGQFGPFIIEVAYTATPGTQGTIEIFDYSAKDGSEQDMVSIPVTFVADAS